MTKKSHQKILADENLKIFWEKVKLGKFSTESEFFSEIGGNLKQREMHHCFRGMDAPAHNVTNIMISLSSQSLSTPRSYIADKICFRLMLRNLKKRCQTRILGCREETTAKPKLRNTRISSYIYFLCYFFNAKIQVLTA